MRVTVTGRGRLGRGGGGRPGPASPPRSSTASSSASTGRTGTGRVRRPAAAWGWPSPAGWRRATAARCWWCRRRAGVPPSRFAPGRRRLTAPDQRRLRLPLDGSTSSSDRVQRSGGPAVAAASAEVSVGGCSGSAEPAGPSPAWGAGRCSAARRGSGPPSPPRPRRLLGLVLGSAGFRGRRPRRRTSRRRARLVGPAQSLAAVSASGHGRAGAVPGKGRAGSADASLYDRIVGTDDRVAPAAQPDDPEGRSPPRRSAGWRWPTPCRWPATPSSPSPWPARCSSTSRPPPPAGGWRCRWCSPWRPSPWWRRCSAPPSTGSRAGAGSWSFARRRRAGRGRPVRRGVVNGLLLFPAAFALLVLSKTHAVAKSSLVPTVVDDARRAGGGQRPPGPGRGGGGHPAADPGRARAAAGRRRVGDALGRAWCSPPVRWPSLRIVQAHPDDPGRRPAATEELRHAGIRLAATAMGVLRATVGFLTFLVAFALRRGGQPAWVFGIVLAASVGGQRCSAHWWRPPLRRRVPEEHLLAGSLGARAGGHAGGRAGGRPGGAGAGRPAPWAWRRPPASWPSTRSCQRDAPDAVQGRVVRPLRGRLPVGVGGWRPAAGASCASRAAPATCCWPSATGASAAAYLAGLARHRQPGCGDRRPGAARRRPGRDTAVLVLSDTHLRRAATGACRPASTGPRLGRRGAARRRHRHRRPAARAVGLGAGARRARQQRPRPGAVGPARDPGGGDRRGAGGHGPRQRAQRRAGRPPAPAVPRRRRGGVRPQPHPAATRRGSTASACSTPDRPPSAGPSPTTPTACWTCTPARWSGHRIVVVWSPAGGRRPRSSPSVVGQVDALQPEAGGVDLGRRGQLPLRPPQPGQAVLAGPLHHALHEASGPARTGPGPGRGRAAGRRSARPLPARPAAGAGPRPGRRSRAPGRPTPVHHVVGVALEGGDQGLDAGQDRRCSGVSMAPSSSPGSPKTAWKDAGSVGSRALSLSSRACRVGPEAPPRRRRSRSSRRARTWGRPSTAWWVSSLRHSHRRTSSSGRLQSAANSVDVGRDTSTSSSDGGRGTGSSYCRGPGGPGGPPWSRPGCRAAAGRRPR